MSPLLDLISRLAGLSGVPMVVGLIVTASVIAVIRDWRFGLWALLIQYVLLGVLHLRMLAPELALIKVLVGALICPMLYWSARWVESERAHKAEVERRMIALQEGEVPLPPLPWPDRATSWVFRLLIVFLLGMLLYSLSDALLADDRGLLPFVAADIAPACLWLGLTGLLTLALTSEPLIAGMGLLTLVAGFELFFDAMSPGLAGVGMFAAINLTMGLAISHMVTVGGLTGKVL